MSSGSTSPATPTTHDKVIRREFRLTEGDAFNALKVKRSQRPHPEPRLSSRTSSRSSRPRARRPTASCWASMSRRSRPASCSCRPAIRASSGSSSSSSITQRNFMGKGQTLARSVNYSIYSKSVEAGLHRALFVRQVDPVRRRALPARLQQLQFHGHQRVATRPTRRSAPAAGMRLGFPLTEYWNFGTRYRPDPGQGQPRQEHLLHRPDGTLRRLRPAEGRHAICATKSASRLTSLVGYSTVFDNTDGIHPTRGAAHYLLSQDFAGAGRQRAVPPDPSLTRPSTTAFGSWILSLHGEGGYIKALQTIAGTVQRSDPAHRPLLLARRSAASTFAASARASVRIPYDTDGNLQTLDINQRL